MALPYVLAPVGTPPFRVSDHGIKPDEFFASIVYRTGHNRLRRLYVGSVPRIATVSWELSAAQMAMVDIWAEDDLEAYTLHFTAQIANITGTGVLYYDANWVEPYASEPMDGGRWVVTGSLYLTGEGETDPPITSLFRSEIFVPVTGSAFVSAETHFAMELNVYLLALTQLRLELSVVVKDFNTVEPPPPAPPPPPPPPPVPFGAFLRPVALLESGTKILATSFEIVSPTTSISRAFTTTDGVSYKQLEDLADPTLPIAFPSGVHHWDAVVGSTILSIGLSVDANFAGQIISNTDPESVAPTYASNDATMDDFFAVGYPRTGGGATIATGSLYTDGTYFYIVGRLADQSQPQHNMYLYRAGTDAVFTQLGQLTPLSGDPNAIASSHYGSFESEWYMLSRTSSTLFSLTSKLKKFGSRSFLIGTFAVYYSDDSGMLTNWTRADLGFGEEFRTNPPVAIIDVIKVGSYLVAIDGSVRADVVSVSSDNGTTWVATAQPAIIGDVAMLRQPVSIGSRAFSYYVLGSEVKVAYADAPYTSWVVTVTTGLPAGNLLSDSYIEAFGGVVFATDHDQLVFTTDGINFDPAILINYFAREVDLSASPSNERNRMLRQDGVGWFKRENYGL